MSKPRYGFNFTWMTSRGWTPPREPDLDALDFLAEHGFDFVRIPMDYRFWTEGTDYKRMWEPTLEVIDRYVQACNERRIHCCLNVHRAPGYCVNANHIEKHNLWADKVAQEGFIHVWESFARRYKGKSSDDLSFDLVNEPPNPGDWGMSREVHKELMTRVIGAIRKIDPAREVVIDGLGCGHLAMPEMAGAGVTHSGRGYQPMALSHYKASWFGPGMGLPAPVWPGVEWEGRRWDRQALVDFYKPWRDVEAKGVKIHIGEFGVYESVSQAVALAWMADLLSVWKEFGWGWSLWNFEGSFGIIGHRRPGARFERMGKYLVDREYFDLLKGGRL